MKSKTSRIYLSIGAALALILAFLGYYFSQEKVFTSPESCDQACLDNFGQNGTCESELSDQSKSIGSCDVEPAVCDGSQEECKCSCYD